MTGLLPGHLLPPRMVDIPMNRAARRAAARRGITVQLGPAGGCPHKPVQFIIDNDNSGSVAGFGGNDPVGGRFEEARLAIEAVSRRCRCGKELVATLSFDSPVSTDVGPTPLRTGMATVERGLRIAPEGGGSSCLGPSLGRARQLADARPDYETVLCVLSDYELLDANVPQVLNELGVFPGQVHAVVLRAAPPQRLADDPRVIVTAVNQTDPPGTLAKAVFAALTSTRTKTTRRQR